jgi:hypothetical protein
MYQLFACVAHVNHKSYVYTYMLTLCGTMWIHVKSCKSVKLMAQVVVAENDLRICSSLIVRRTRLYLKFTLSNTLAYFCVMIGNLDANLGC